MPNDLGYKADWQNLSGTGTHPLFPQKPNSVIIHAVCVVADANCAITFGHTDGGFVPDTAKFFLLARTPLVLPFTEDGWWLHPGGHRVRAEITGAGTPNVAVQLVFARAAKVD